MFYLKIPALILFLLVSSFVHAKSKYSEPKVNYSEAKVTDIATNEDYVRVKLAYSKKIDGQKINHFTLSITDTKSKDLADRFLSLALMAKASNRKLKIWFEETYNKTYDKNSGCHPSNCRFATHITLK